MKLAWYYGGHKCVSRNGKLYINVSLKKWQIILILLIKLPEILKTILFKGGSNGVN